MVLLINPSDRNILENSGDRAPLGLLYLSAALKKNDIDHKVFDMNHDKLNDLYYYLISNKEKQIGISIFTSAVFNNSINLIHQLRGLTRNPEIIAGGYHVTAEPDSLENIVTITGYGESKLINHLKGTNEQFDINRYPIPNRDSVDMKNYNMAIEGLKSTLMTTSRGCVFDCSFCGNFERKVSYRDKSNIDEEINLIKNKYGFGAIYFTDDSFTLNKSHAENVGNIAKKHDIKYRIATRASLLNEDNTRMLKDTGCIYVGLGIESGDNEILKKVNKHMTTEQNFNAIRLLNKNKIKSKGFFIIGLPDETYETAFRTIDFAKKLKKEGLNYADFYPLVPYCGSDIYKHPSKYGLEILSMDYDKYIQAGKEVPISIIKGKYLNGLEVQKLVKKAYEVWNE